VVAVHLVGMSFVTVAQAGVQSPCGLYPQRVTSRMEVDVSSRRSCRLGWVERVGINYSSAARGAQAVRTFTRLLLFAGLAAVRRSGRLLRDAQADLLFDPSAIGAQVFCLQLGNLVADPADSLCRFSSVEGTQTRTEHRGPSFCGVAGDSPGDPTVNGELGTASYGVIAFLMG